MRSFCWTPLAASGANLVTVDDLVGREFSVEDHWAGQEFAFKRQGEEIIVVWRVLGSGRPVVSERSYPVEKRSEKQCVFFIEREGKRGEVKIALSEEAEIKVYLEGIRIYVTEKTPNQSSEPTPTSVTICADAQLAPAAVAAHL